MRINAARSRIDMRIDQCTLKVKTGSIRHQGPRHHAYRYVAELALITKQRFGPFSMPAQCSFSWFHLNTHFDNSAKTWHVNSSCSWREKDVSELKNFVWFKRNEGWKCKFCTKIEGEISDTVQLLVDGKKLLGNFLKQYVECTGKKSEWHSRPLLEINSWTCL